MRAGLIVTARLLSQRIPCDLIVSDEQLKQLLLSNDKDVRLFFDGHPNV